MDYAQARAQVDAQHPAPRVLAVADDPELRQQLREALTGFEVIEAEEGDQALAAVKEELPDLVLTPLVLPGMDGVALLEQLRAYQPKLPVVVLVGEGEAEAVADKGFDGVADQPVEAAALRGAVGGLLEREGLA